jgi:hypothetical protein
MQTSLRSLHKLDCAPGTTEMFERLALEGPGSGTRDLGHETWGTKTEDAVRYNRSRFGQENARPLAAETFRVGERPPRAGFYEPFDL